MDNKDILSLAGDPRFIPGIYNYCDRWCERCMFISRCLNYKMGQEEDDDPEARDLNNEKFWEKLYSIFQQTREMVEEVVKEQGIDPDSLDMEAAEEENHRRKAEAEAHELSRAAREYREMVDNWFKSEQSLFEQKEDDLNTRLEFGIDGNEPYAEAVGITDKVEVIRWYQPQIYTQRGHK